MTTVAATRNVVAAQYLRIGIEHFQANQFARAIACFDEVLRIEPDDTYAKYNRATALLSNGDYGRGFAEYEVAWRLFHWKGFGPVGDDAERLNTLPLWRGGRDIPSGNIPRVLVYHEMGHGDAIMALRFVPELKRRATVVLVLDPCLHRLAWPFDIKTVAKVPDDLTTFDARLPLFGVMAALRTTAATVPDKPYIAARFQPNTGRIGIAWSGRTQTSFTLERFKELLRHDGYTLHALQPGPLADDEVEPLPPAADFGDVKHRIETMDHVVSVDTAAVHLAGAMGHTSTHLLLPYLMDWRWWRAAAWYPMLKTYPQSTPHDWTAPFAKLNEALR